METIQEETVKILPSSYLPLATNGDTAVNKLDKILVLPPRAPSPGRQKQAPPRYILAVSF